MFVVKNLRKKEKDGWTYLVVDFEVTGMKSPFEEKTMWFAVENENADMLTDDVYDAFVLVPLYLGMHYHQDVHIEGKISPRLYHNITHYIMRIFDEYSDDTVSIDFTVDGFKMAKKGPVNLVATGLTCGVDSLVSIYDNYVKTDDRNFKINSLIFTNCGTHGHYEDDKTRKVWLSRAKNSQKAADELDLPMYLIDSNLHAFTHKIGEVKIGNLAIWSCAIALQRYIKRYIVASDLAYDDMKRFYKYAQDTSIVEYTEGCLVPLVTTEKIELVSDGCQYTREQKTERISDWVIARKYLNVCSYPVDYVDNCARCPKCMRTLLVLEAMGKLDDFKHLFDMEAFRKNKFLYECAFVIAKGKEPYPTKVLEYLHEHNKITPPKVIAWPTVFSYKVFKKIRWLMGKAEGSRI